MYRRKQHEGGRMCWTSEWLKDALIRMKTWLRCVESIKHIINTTTYPLITALVTNTLAYMSYQVKHVMMKCLNTQNRNNVPTLRGSKYINPLTAGAAYIRFFYFYWHIKYHISNVKDEWRHQPARFEKSWPPFCQIWIIFTHLKLWIASATHNFKWVKIQIE